MFPIRMIHEHHGATHVYDHNSLEVNKKAGWVVDEPKESAPAAAPITQPVVQPTVVKAKPGRKAKGK